MRENASRRSFLKTAGAAPLVLLPARARGAAPSDTFNLGFIGLGGQGRGLLEQVARGNVQANIVAMCDVDDEHAAKAFRAGLEAFPKAKTYRDYRRMLDEAGKQIDGVVIATPNHQHLLPGLSAMQLHKHVYLEKPLAPTVSEIRRLMRAQERYNVITQMGNYGHSLEGMATARSQFQSGVLGEVREVHAWTANGSARKMSLGANRTAPPGVDWDRWLGPARWREYSQAYIRPWRAWWDFGGGALFDYGCHTMDTPVYALDLGAPLSVEAVKHEFVSEDQPPRATILRYEFPARGKHPPVTMTWYDAPNRPPEPPELRAGETLDGIQWAGEGGAVFLGDRKKMVAAGMKPFHIEMLPIEGPREKARVAPGGVVGRASIAHMRNWVEAAKERRRSGADFVRSSGPLTEIVAIGAVAQRMPPGSKLLWDANAARFTNSSEANAYLEPYVRKGWEFKTLRKR